MKQRILFWSILVVTIMLILAFIVTYLRFHQQATLDASINKMTTEFALQSDINYLVSQKFIPCYAEEPRFNLCRQRTEKFAYYFKGDKHKESAGLAIDIWLSKRNFIIRDFKNNHMFLLVDPDKKPEGEPKISYIADIVIEGIK